MTVKLAFLGTGTCHSTPRNPSAIALSNGDVTAMIDCGGGSYHQISRIADSHFSRDRIACVVLTHFHIDHVAGLADLIWGEMWAPGGARTAPLTIAGPTGLRSFVDDRLLPFIGDHGLPFELRTLEFREGETFNGPFFNAQSVKLLHQEPSTGWLLSIEGTRLLITGDTGMCDNLPAALSESDIAVMEWSEPGESDYSHHISGPDIRRLMEMGVLPGKVYITHIYLPRGKSFEGQTRENRDYLGDAAGMIHFPRDLDIITIGREVP